MLSAPNSVNVDMPNRAAGGGGSGGGSASAPPSIEAIGSNPSPPRGLSSLSRKYGSISDFTIAGRQPGPHDYSAAWKIGTTDKGGATRVLQTVAGRGPSTSPPPGETPSNASEETLNLLSQMNMAEKEQRGLAERSPSAPVAPAPTEEVTSFDGTPLAPFQSLYQDRLFNQPSAAVEAILSASCEVMGFDIAEMWLRTGLKTHQLTNSHLRPTALQDSARAELVDVYYGDMSSQRTHRLSPALCKRAKEAQDVVWVTANTDRGAEALKCSISDVRTAVAVPVCHGASQTNITVIYFSIRRAVMKPQVVEFLVHMSLSAAVTSINSLSEECFVDKTPRQRVTAAAYAHAHMRPEQSNGGQLSRSEHAGHKAGSTLERKGFSITGACLDLNWTVFTNVEYLTDGGNNWIHTSVMNGRPVVVKTLKPECQDLALAINEIEGELDVHAKLDHGNIVALVGAGRTSKGSRFVVLERLDGGTLTQHLGYDTRIRDRRRRFWKKKTFSFLEVLACAKSISDAMNYCHNEAIPGSMVLHRDLKPDNIGFTLDGTVKVIDFGLARIVDKTSPDSDAVYQMSGETGSLRYMAPEVADCRPYNHKADVYSFGTILWEIVALKKPYDGMNREEFYDQVVHGGERPPMGKKWPSPLVELIQQCWDNNLHVRPNFNEISERLEVMIANEKGGRSAKKIVAKKVSKLIDRHSTWF